MPRTIYRIHHIKRAFKKLNALGLKGTMGSIDLPKGPSTCPKACLQISSGVRANHFKTLFDFDWMKLVFSGFIGQKLIGLFSFDARKKIPVSPFTIHGQNGEIKEQNDVSTTMILEPVASSAFSFWDLFWHADWIVKGVILSLCAGSVWSWAIIFSKIQILQKLHRSARRIRLHFQEGSLDGNEIRFLQDCPFGRLWFLVAKEWRNFQGSNGDFHQKGMQRLEYLMGIQVDQQRQKLLKSMSVLESIGSKAPFIGLFGTVWGIMNSFQGIANSKNTSLAVVAPGIAEALFATAIALAVSIPAVIAYNRLTASIEDYAVSMENFAQELLAGCLRGS
jgi:biopolymer transport protein TolQ